MVYFIVMQERFTEQCPGCGGKMSVRHLACAACGIKVEGEIPLPTLARLTPEEREFIEVFVLCGGSLKDAGQVLGISYPTVRTRLDQVMASLKALTGQTEETRMSVLDKLEKGEITAKEAGRRLRLLK